MTALLQIRQMCARMFARNACKGNQSRALAWERKHEFYKALPNANGSWSFKTATGFKSGEIMSEAMAQRMADRMKAEDEHEAIHGTGAVAQALRAALAE